MVIDNYFLNIKFTAISFTQDAQVFKKQVELIDPIT